MILSGKQVSHFNLFFNISITKNLISHLFIKGERLVSYFPLWHYTINILSLYILLATCLVLSSRNKAKEEANV